jgi:hypothetical protein
MFPDSFKRARRNPSPFETSLLSDPLLCFSKIALH